MNLFRLVLAATVLFAHAWYIAGRGVGPALHGENLGGWAVAGFFVLSGFLITRSRLRTAAGEYLLHRVMRIYPAFLVCLLVTVLIFAPVSLLLSNGSLSGYLSTAPSPAQYVWGNLGLQITQYDIGATLDSVPYPNAWNGSLWTLYFEFLCYLTVWVLGGWALFRRSIVPAATLFVLSVLVWANISVATTLGLDQNFVLFVKLLPFFLGGAVAHFVIDRAGINTIVGILSLAVSLSLIVFVPVWGGQIAAPFLAYGLLFLSSVIPQPSLIARNDISYGFYIYAWPVQQLVVLVGGHRAGMAVYIGVTVVITAILATASWWAVERPSMRAVRKIRPSAEPVAHNS